MSCHTDLKESRRELTVVLKKESPGLQTVELLHREAGEPQMPVFVFYCDIANDLQA